MTNVIGPIPKITWGAMRELKGGINFMAANNQDSRFSRALEREARVYDKFLKKVTIQEAA